MGMEVLRGLLRRSSSTTYQLYDVDALRMRSSATKFLFPLRLIGFLTESVPWSIFIIQNVCISFFIIEIGGETKDYSLDDF